MTSQIESCLACNSLHNMKTSQKELKIILWRLLFLTIKYKLHIILGFAPLCTPFSCFSLSLSLTHTQTLNHSFLSLFPFISLTHTLTLNLSLSLFHSLSLSHTTFHTDPKNSHVREKNPSLSLTLFFHFSLSLPLFSFLSLSFVLGQEIVSYLYPVIFRMTSPV